MKSESDIEQRVCRWAEDHGILHSKLNPMGRRGWPDRVFWIRGGKPLLLEFKKLGEKPTKLQSYILAQLKARNYDIGWTDNKEEAVALLRTCEEAAQAVALPAKRR